MTSEFYTESVVVKNCPCKHLITSSPSQNTYTRAKHDFLNTKTLFAFDQVYGSAFGRERSRVLTMAEAGDAYAEDIGKEFWQWYLHAHSKFCYSQNHAYM